MRIRLLVDVEVPESHQELYLVDLQAMTQEQPRVTVVTIDTATAVTHLHGRFMGAQEAPHS